MDYSDITDNFYRLDNIAWKIEWSGRSYLARPHCLKCKLALQQTSLSGEEISKGFKSAYLCRYCQALKRGSAKSLTKKHELEQAELVIEIAKAKELKKLKVINIDGELVPIAEEKVETNKYFLTTELKEEAKSGQPQIIIYAGETGKQDKAQIFIDPTHQRLSFDQNDTHPTGLLAKITVEFADGSRSVIEK